MKRPGDRSLRFATAIALMLAIALPVALAADWPQFRGGPELTGVAYDPLPAAPALGLAWTFDAGEEVQSSPAISAGTVYIGSKAGRLHALDLATGKERFRYEAGGEIRSSPAVRNGIVYVGDESGTFHAIDAKTGAKRWTFEAGGAISSSPNFTIYGKQSRALFGS